MKTYIKYGKAICYSGYRENQSPITKTYPTYKEVYEDLKILENDFDYIRMYDASSHAKTVLEVIKNEELSLKVLLGIDLLGEISNPNCAWGGDYSDSEIASNIRYNNKQLEEIIRLCNVYPDIVLGVSAGNEAVPDWNENLVSSSRVLYFVTELKSRTNTVVTYCDNFYYWTNKLTEVAKYVDVISIHTYPLWNGYDVDESIKLCIKEYNQIKDLYPDKQVIITETGWATTSNSSQMKHGVANEDNQVKYNQAVDEWSEQEEIPVFFFEAFDEPWKGSSNNEEPEKHWGYYFVNRNPKKIKK